MLLVVSPTGTVLISSSYTDFKSFSENSFRPLHNEKHHQATCFGIRLYFVMCNRIGYFVDDALNVSCGLLYYTTEGFVGRLPKLLLRSRETSRGVFLLQQPIWLQDNIKAKQVKIVVAANRPAKMTR